jgi:ubiquitin carboxyl-terminal hydrolase 5/13
MGGNSHGLAHANTSSHSVAVKLGSITPEGSADVFCYCCNEERIDPNLSTHLAYWGIDIAHLEKTEKSLMEMQIEQNLKWDFSLTAEDGQELKPVFGAGLTGLRNLGNSCYLASILQCLFSLPDFQQRYFRPLEKPLPVGAPAEDLETQLRKIADGLLSGRYSLPDLQGISSTDAPRQAHQKGLAPAMLKYLIGRGHEEFSTMRQQDAFELLLYLFKLIGLSSHPKELHDPVGSFRFALEQRIQCLSCQKVRYKVDQQDNISVPVPVRRLTLDNRFAESDETRESSQNPEFEPVTLKECLDIFTGEEIVELTCSSCGSQDGFRKRSLFKTFPRNLAINIRRFEVVNWVPTKLNIPVEVGDEPLDMSVYMSPGLQEGEELLPCETQVTRERSFVPNKEILDQLLSMGFSKSRSEKALHATGNADPEAAVNWLFVHMSDESIDDPTEFANNNPTSASPSDQDAVKIAKLGDMGIDPARARKALSETGGDVNRALDWVLNHPGNCATIDDTDRLSGDSSRINLDLPGFADIPARFQLQSVVCHKGTSIHTG